MNFLRTNNQDTLIFGGSPNNKIIFSNFKLTFVTKSSYGGHWFQATVIEDGYNGLTDKLSESDWEGSYDITALKLKFLSIKINGTLYNVGGTTIFNATNYTDYVFRNDGYGLGFVSYIDQLNIILQNYQLNTRFYPALDNQIIGIIDTAENFEVTLLEVAEGPDIEREFLIRCVYGNVFDSVVGESELEWA